MSKGSKTRWYAAEESNGEEEKDVGLPPLISGEGVRHWVDQVLVFQPQSDSSSGSGVSGRLYVTDFAVRFLSICLDSNHEVSIQSKYLGHNDIPLASITNVFSDKGEKLRSDKPSLSSRILRIHTMNFRVVTFDLRLVEKGKFKKFLESLSKALTISSREQLFGSVNRKERKNPTEEPFRFLRDSDWNEELADAGWCLPLFQSEKRGLKRSVWQVSNTTNSAFFGSSSPPLVLSPIKLRQMQLQDLSTQLEEHRPPVWCYTLPSGASLVRCPTLSPESGQPHQLQKFLSSLPKATADCILDLRTRIGTADDVQQAYEKLRQLVMPESHGVAEDHGFLSAYQATGWPQLIRTCFETALHAAHRLADLELSTILQAEDDRGLNCVVASLVELLLRPSCRTLDGLQRLINKNWIVSGHQFINHHLLKKSPGRAVSSMFLLFLDCLHQLLKQVPHLFSFNLPLLLMLWDSCGMGLFEEFVFDLEYMRRHQCGSISVWRWDEQYTETSMLLTNSPWYIMEESSYIRTSKEPGADRIKNIRILSLDIWRECYFRWTADSDVLAGGPGVEYLQACSFVCDTINRALATISGIRVGLNSNKPDDGEASENNVQSAHDEELDESLSQNYDRLVSLRGKLINKHQIPQSAHDQQVTGRFPFRSITSNARCASSLIQLLQLSDNASEASGDDITAPAPLIP